MGSGFTPTSFAAPGPTWFRSVLVPLNAAFAILVSIGSAFGVVVAIFRWGWLKDLVGLEETMPIISRPVDRAGGCHS